MRGKINNVKNNIGKKFGKLEIIKIITNRSKNINYPRKKGLKKTKVINGYTAVCKCLCGNQVNFSLKFLKNGNVLSCGCHVYDQYINKKFGMLTVMEIYPSHRLKNGKYIETMAKCKCDCGIIKIIRFAGVKIGHSKSCGCRIGQAQKTHGLSNTKVYPLYSTWSGINSRCYNKNDDNYKDYGGRGISNFWQNDPHGFMAYIEKELGQKPSPKHSLDRINNDGNYEPGNIRWATQAEQGANKTQVNERLIQRLKNRINSLEILAKTVIDRLIDNYNKK